MMSKIASSVLNSSGLTQATRNTLNKTWNVEMKQQPPSSYTQKLGGRHQVLLYLRQVSSLLALSFGIGMSPLTATTNLLLLQLLKFCRNTQKPKLL